MRLIRFQKKPLKRLRRVRPHKMEIGPKPSGLWVSDEDAEESWSWWCSSEQPDWIEGTQAIEVRLAPDANILFLRNALDIREFTAEYVTKPPGVPEGLLDGWYIDWPKVAKRYDGIIITPYVWSCRHDRETFWYYGWDCASGCIWNPEAVAGFDTETMRALDYLEGVL